MSSRLLMLAVALLLTIHASDLRAEQRLHVAIDQLLSAKIGNVVVSAKADDAEFVRRVYLDLIGRIPNEAECREFLLEKSSKKREQLIDRLLDSDQYAANMANRFHIMLMERRGDEAEWMRFLIDAFRTNKPWDQMAREIVTPSTESETTRGAAYFYTKRLEKYGQNPVDYPGLVRDVGRMFMGVDVQCAQCHDHLFVDAYKQVDYQGLFAFVGGTSIRRDTKFPAVAEKPLVKKIEFQSVFDTDKQSTGPRLPFGRELTIPEFKKGEEYEVPPDKKLKTPGVLKFSPLKALGDELPRPDNKLFAANIANRLWWLMMGRGLVEPLDLHHGDNPPSHPELLARLADEVVKSKFDIKHVLREIALSQAYQRSSLLPDGLKAEPPLASYRTAIERPLAAKQILDSIHVALGDSATKDGDAAKAEGDDESSDYDTQLTDFREALANPPREPETQVNPTVKAALFFMHSDRFLESIQRKPGNLIDRLMKVEKTDEAAETLFLAVLSRRPDPEELQLVREHLKSMKDRPDEAWIQLTWSLLASTEFAVNH